MLRPELRETIRPPWTTLEPVLVGEVPSGYGTPSSYVTVEQDGSPILRIDVHEREPAPHAFQDTIAWAGFIVIGFGDRVHFVSVGSRETATVSLSGYFGHLYPFQDHLLVADAQRLCCFDRSGSILWRSPELGIDGVLVNDVADGVVEGQGEWDPPGGWRPFRLLLSSGALVSDSA